MGMRPHKILTQERTVNLSKAPLYNYSRRVILFSSNRQLKIFVKHNQQTYFSFNICRNYIFGDGTSLMRLGIGYVTPIYARISKYKTKLRYPDQITQMDVDKLFGLAKKAKRLNPGNWVFWQDPRNPKGPIYEVFPDKRSHNVYFTTKPFIL